MNKKVYVKSRPVIEIYGTEEHKERAILVSIAARDQEPAMVCCTEKNNIKDILFVHFNDTDSREEGSGCIEKEDAEKIRDFVEKYAEDDSIDAIIVNCGAGQSRSAGCAAAILMHYTQDDSQIYGDKRYTPNRLVYSEVLNAFEGETDWGSIFGGVKE